MSRCAVMLVLGLLGFSALAQPAAPTPSGTVWITLRPQASLPLKSPRVQAGGKDAVATGGAFRVDGLGSGPVIITASAEGYQAVEKKVLLPAGGQASVFLPLERIPGPGTVKGRVLREEGREGKKVPLADIEVQLGGKVVARSDAEGLFVVPEAGPGPVTLKLAGSGVRPQEEVVVVPPHGEASVEVVLQKGEEIRAWMRGRVRSTQGRPVVATLKIEEARIKARTRAAGDFEFRLPAGRYHVTFEARGFVSQTKVVDVAAGDQALFYVDLSPLEN
ncbi:carboxypeptidase regulatory-like domain-containing protein [Hyalangium versicolor]|uniref:carboxypeptidase regulatory-like domain-containing protein n=1 Tax=Hyalangium versicolor TaxID=2861190 RepID=UPI001CCF2ED0|nr:carboxypeptidase regulatory-like domain-containing protein [Hyalangium versicolor]